MKMKRSKAYRPPVTISRSEFLTRGSDSGFRASIYAMVQSVGRLLACRGSTSGSQPYLVKAYLNNGSMLMDACRIEGFGGFEGKMKLAQVNGKGTVTVRDSGQLVDLDVSEGITVKVA